MVKLYGMCAVKKGYVRLANRWETCIYLKHASRNKVAISKLFTVLS